MSRDPRYSTAAWQKLRCAVLERDGHVCQLQGPRCRGYATTVHHIVPSSQGPELFWEPSNLAAACSRCNYGGGARIAHANRRATITKLQELVWEQQAEIDRLTDRLRRYEDENGMRRRPSPAIH